LRDFPPKNFFVKFLLFLEISPHPSLKKRGEFFITFPPIFKGRVRGGVGISSAYFLKPSA